MLFLNFISYYIELILLDYVSHKQIISNMSRIEKYLNNSIQLYSSLFKSLANQIRRIKTIKVTF